MGLSSTFGHSRERRGVANEGAPCSGFPISLKNQICVEGVESNMVSVLSVRVCPRRTDNSSPWQGYVGWIGRVPKKNSVLADCLVRSGAVLYCQTSEFCPASCPVLTLTPYSQTSRRT